MATCKIDFKKLFPEIDWENGKSELLAEASNNPKERTFHFYSTVAGMHTYNTILSGVGSGAYIPDLVEPKEEPEDKNFKPIRLKMP